MFDYAQRLQLALKDTARRSAMKAAAGIVLAVAAGFLVAALWSFLAHNLGWGPALASLVVAGLFILAGLILFGPGVFSSLSLSLILLIYGWIWAGSIDFRFHFHHDGTP